LAGWDERRRRRRRRKSGDGDIVITPRVIEEVHTPILCYYSIVITPTSAHNR